MSAATVGQLLNRIGQTEVFSITPDRSIMEAVQLMTDKNVGALVVLNKNEQLVGIVSERDVARALALDSRVRRFDRVWRITTTDVLTCTPLTTVEECKEIMRQRSVRHVPVVEKERVIGIVSIRDILVILLKYQELLADDLQGYILGATYRG